MSDDMCPNCVTPWKCNGPHCEVVDDAEVLEVAGRAAERWAGTLRILGDTERVVSLTDFLLARVAEDETLALHRLSGDTSGSFPSPARVLAECEAKRRIATAYDSPSLSAQWLLGVLALPYSDHPDYNPDWRP